jgi:cytochrome bd-type quinol oxidase subunit 2
MKAIKRLLSVVAVFALAFGVFGLATSGSTSAAAVNERVCNGINTVIEGGDVASSNPDCTGGDTDGSNTLAKTINSVINLFSLIVGAASVIMIIYGGFKYITSGGSDDATKSAKNTILYALVGLIIVLLAQTIVKFVFSKATSLDTQANQ